MKNIAYGLSLVVIFLVPSGEFVKTGLGTASRTAGLLLGAVWLASVFQAGRARKVSLFHAALGVFLLWHALSVFWSINVDASLARLFSLTRMLLLTVILWDLYTTTERIRAGLQAFVLGAYVPVISTISNYTAATHGDWTRYSSSGNNSNSTAIIITMAMPLALHLALSPAPGSWRRWGSILKIANYVFVPAAVVGAALTGTRFAIVMSVPTLIYFVLMIRRLKSAARIPAFAALGITMVVVASAVPDSLIRRLASLQEEASSGDLNGRTQYWKEGIQVWMDRPLTGVGTNTFTHAVPSGRSAHNSFVAILTELGLVGLILFGAVLLVASMHAWRHPPSEMYFWLTLFVILLLGNLPLTYAYMRGMWLLLGLLVASSSLSHRDHWPRRASQREASPSRAAGIRGAPA